METVFSALIAGTLSLIGVVVTNIMSNKQIEHKLEINQAITDTKLDNIANEVKQHNSGFLQIPVILEKLENMERRVEFLENKLK